MWHGVRVGIRAHLTVSVVYEFGSWGTDPERYISAQTDAACSGRARTGGAPSLRHDTKDVSAAASRHEGYFRFTERGSSRGRVPRGVLDALAAGGSVW
jgi:hypothetical protein